MRQAGYLPELLDNYQQKWWINPKLDSLRLSLDGFSFVKTVLKLQSFEFKVPILSNGQLLQLEKLIGGMYCIVHRKKLIVFDDTVAMMLILHDSDLPAYLTTLIS